MRWSRHLLAAALVFSLPAIALCVFWGGPIWVALWGPWVVGCFLLRRGRVLGAAMLLLSSAALVSTVWDGEMQLRLPESQAYMLLVPSLVAAVGGSIAMFLLRRAFQVDRRAALALLGLCIGAGLAGSAIFSSLPKVPACPRGTVVVGPLLRGWYWLNGNRYEGLIDGNKVLWLRDCLGGGPGTCYEMPVDGAGVARRWAISASELLDDDLQIRGGDLVSVTGRLESEWQVRGYGYAPNGWSKRWFDNGRQRSAGEERDHDRVGTWRFWWPNGQLSAVGQYCAGKVCGRWQFWDQQGTSRPKKSWMKLQDYPFLDLAHL